MNRLNFTEIVMGGIPIDLRRVCGNEIPPMTNNLNLGTINELAISLRRGKTIYLLLGTIIYYYITYIDWQTGTCNSVNLTENRLSSLKLQFGVWIQFRVD